MHIKDYLKEILYVVNYKSVTGKRMPQDYKAYGIISLVVSFVTIIMSYLNFVEHEFRMMVTTLIITIALVIVFIASITGKGIKIVNAGLCISFFIVCIVFTLAGRNDGFAILWSLLIPPSAMVLVKFSHGILISVLFEIFIIAIFWTPLSDKIAAYYSDTFILRFPMLFTAFLILSILVKYYIIKKEIAEDKADAEIERLMSKLENQASTDPMTGLYNRRFFMEHADLRLKECLRNNKSFSIIYYDIDKFKSVNDIYGHAAGDAIICTVAEISSNQVRPYDLVARFGGEEFIIFLPDADIEVAEMIAERLRKSVEEKEIDHDSQMLNVTISLGVVNSEGNMSDLNELIGIADKALYEAKEGGRNRTVIFR